MKSLDEVLVDIGELGRAQLVLYLFTGLAWAQGAAVTMLPVFADRAPDTLLDPSLCVGDAHAAALAMVNGSVCAAPACARAVVDPASSSAAEFGLLCNTAWQAELPATLYFAGYFAGCAVFGPFADRYGRKPTFLLAQLMLLIFSVLSGFAPNVTTYTALRLLSGFATSGQAIGAYMLSSEFIGRRYRSITGTMYSVFFSLGIIFLCGLAALVTEWRTLTLIAAGAGVLFLLPTCLIPESPRFLMVQGRHDQAVAVLRRVARMNGRAHVSEMWLKVNLGLNVQSDTAASPPRAMEGQRLLAASPSPPETAPADIMPTTPPQAIEVVLLPATGAVHADAASAPGLLRVLSEAAMSDGSDAGIHSDQDSVDGSGLGGGAGGLNYAALPHVASTDSLLGAAAALPHVSSTDNLLGAAAALPHVASTDSLLGAMDPVARAVEQAGATTITQTDAGLASGAPDADVGAPLGEAVFVPRDFSLGLEAASVHAEVMNTAADAGYSTDSSSGSSSGSPRPAGLLFGVGSELAPEAAQGAEHGTRHGSFHCDARVEEATGARSRRPTGFALNDLPAAGEAAWGAAPGAIIELPGAGLAEQCADSVPSVNPAAEPAAPAQLCMSLEVERDVSHSSLPVTVAQPAAAAARKQESCFRLFRAPVVRGRLAVMLLTWFANSYGYFGLSLSAGTLGDDRILSLLYSALVEVPALALTSWMLSKLGRRPVVGGMTLLGGLACMCLVAMPVPEWCDHSGTTCGIKTLRMAVSLLGKFAVTGSFAALYVYAAELFPTVVRSAAVGLSSQSARVGAMCAPMTISLAQVWLQLPFAAFGAALLLGGLAVLLLLPESIGKPLPETFEDIKASSPRARSRGKWCRQR